MLRICISGGPCSGKTVGLNILIQKLEERGYHVFTVFEAASSLILNGIKPSSHISMSDFQEFILDMQMSAEKIFDDVTKYYNPDKTIIFYDRGIMDGAAYVDRAEFVKLLGRKNLTLSDVYNRYDAVFHMVTAADGAEEFYLWNDPNKDDVGNNAARRESPEEARIKDKLTLNAWIGHPHLRVFDNSTDFKGKIDRIIKEVFALLGEPVPSEIERKYLIKKPTDEQIKSLGCISETQIIQTYLKKFDNVAERRVRQRGTKKDGFSFYYTEKTDVAPGVRIENERKISKDEYLDLLSEADTSLHQISKTRYCFVYEKQYFEMDIYPFSDEYAIVEIELNDINETVKLPPLDLIKDVTNDKNYSNYALAKTLSLNT
jgi:CYTH domain-containing protein/predicted ATPase